MKNNLLIIKKINIAVNVSVWQSKIKRSARRPFPPSSEETNDPSWQQQQQKKHRESVTAYEPNK
jgi:hypothetical protein